MRYSIGALPLACALLAVAILLGGCQEGGSSSPSPPPSSQGFPFTFNLSTNKTSYVRSEVVHATFTITNVGSQTGYYLAGDYDATVSRKGQVVWQLSKRPGYQVATDYITAPLTPGMSAPFPVDWDQRDLQGNYVAPGQYTLVAWLAGGKVGFASPRDPIQWVPTGACPNDLIPAH